MIDLKKYPDGELSLQVYNTEDLHGERHEIELFNMIQERFTFTAKQFEVLIEDLRAEIKEQDNGK